MNTKNIIISILIIALAVFAGRAWGRYETNLRAVQAYENLPTALKDEFRGMSKDDYSRIMTAIKEYSKNAVIELSLKDLFEAMTVVRIEASLKENGIDGVDSYIASVKERFLSGHSR